MDLTSPPSTLALPRRQIAMSPYYGEPDFSSLAGRAPLDLVSVADLLRNAFVYAPHSIFENFKLATFGFDPGHDLEESPSFRFPFPDDRKALHQTDPSQDLVGAYHRLLCDALGRSCDGMRSPWLLQSGGKDSTSLAIAASDVRPDVTCITYLGGREEDEIDSARSVATSLGLRHQALVCDPGRAYDRYLDLIPSMPLLTADFATLSYADLATEIAGAGGDGVVDGLGSDCYFGTPASALHKLISRMACRLPLPRSMVDMPLVDRSFALCFGLATLQMDHVERIFPGSRFLDSEVDALFGYPISSRSRERQTFRPELDSASSADELRAIAITVEEATSAFAKGLYITNALSLRAAYPFCDSLLRDWVYRQVPADQMIDPESRANKVLVRKHIRMRFDELPYVSKKGSFRFDLSGLAKCRYDAVYAFAEEARDVLPGATKWLERNRSRLGNKYHASKFYLLAIVLPWIVMRGRDGESGR